MRRTLRAVTALLSHDPAVPFVTADGYVGPDRMSACHKAAISARLDDRLGVIGNPLGRI